ncbi:hypothetical protein [Streptacidiphilus sp. EB129]|uniref:hypothetical protein n=1 Tax=Streptacidiphilus sp. EB129 TaxID=3156262 RepID=UPI00351969CE
MNGRSDLIDRLGAFFPDSSGYDWLTSQADRSFGDAFGMEQDGGGWLDAQQYAEFWGYCREYAEGQDLDQLAGFLERLLSGWEMAAGQQQSAAPDSEDRPRYIDIDPVSGYPGWWQGYDLDDQEWRYVRADAAPTTGTEGWVDYAAAFPVTEDPPGEAAEGRHVPFDPQAASQAVLARVMGELTEPDENGEVPPEVTEQERTELWSEVWAEVHKAAAGWGPKQEDRVVDAVVQAYLGRLQDEGDADLLLAEIQSFIDLLAKGNPR